MTEGVVKLNILQFSLIYLLLIIVLIVMKRSRIQQSKLLLWASLRMTVQLVLAGWLLTYIFQHQHWAFTAVYLVAMLVFAVVRVLSKVKHLNHRFKWIISLSFVFAGMFVLCYFVLAVVGKSLFNPQYTIPLAGMILGNAMTGVNLGLKTFCDNVKDRRNEIETLLNLGVHPREILLPFANSALETALLPTLNTMLGMGIIYLPGMMTGQILSGTLPTTAIMYQIAIMVAICASVALTTFSALHFGSQTLFNSNLQLND